MEVQAVPRVAVAGRTGMVSSRGLRVASDARLVALVREGNRAAFERIYDRYHHPILSFCRHMLGDPEEAADAVQHTFLAAYNAITSSDKPILLRAWLFTIARNRCYSVLRARREQPAAELAEPSTEGLASQVQRREDLRQLLADVRRLPDDQRAALVLAELGTLNHREIGSALGVPPAKVKALVFQARESLIASRVARDTDCTEIRRQLSTLRGGALRRVHLRRHLRDCEACREYRTHVERQRRGLAAILPVIPPLALKEVVLGGTAGAGTAATAVAGGGLLAFKGLALKGALCAVFALAGTAGTFALIHAQHSHRAAGLVPASVAPISGPVAPASVDAAGVARSRPVSHHARPSILDRRRSKHHSVRRTAVRATAIPAGLLRHTVPAAPSRRASVVRHGHPSGARRHVHHPPTPAPRPSPPPAPAGGGTQATSGGQQGPGGQSGQGGQGGGTQQGQGGGNGQGPGGGTGQGPGGGDGQGQGGGGPGGDNGGGGGGIGGPGGGQGGPGGGQGGPGGGQGNPEGGQGGPGGGQGNWQGEPGNPQGPAR
jgi:RNA polymerase sigma factor (sigma-70 family)